MSAVVWPKRSVEAWRYVDTQRIARLFSGKEALSVDAQADGVPIDTLLSAWQQKHDDQWHWQAAGASMPSTDLWHTSPLHDWNDASGNQVYLDVARTSQAPLLTVLKPGEYFGSRHLRLQQGSSLSWVVVIAPGEPVPMHQLQHVILESGSRLDLTIIHGGAGVHWHEHYFELHQDSHLTIKSLQMASGSSYGRESYHIHLSGDQAHAHFEGLTCVQHRSHIDQVVEMVHAGRHTQSHQHHVQLLNDQAQSGFHSEVRVLPGAIKTESTQNARALLLSKGAVASSKPRLQIDCDDVACQHGAVVGPLDEAALFYMQTRGLSVTQARYLLVHGFIATFVDKLDDEVLQPWATAALKTMLETWLGGEHVG